jgi:hypothetical protein
MRRWIAFILVGVSGIAIQLSALAVLSGRLGLDYLLATGQGIVSVLIENQQHSWCRKILTGLRLPPTVHCHSYYRVGQRRFYPYAVDGDQSL